MAFESITDAKVEELLSLPKRVTNANTRTKLKECHEQMNYTVACTIDEKCRFVCYSPFVRPQNPLL
jgi:hypothetical protein